MVLAGIGGEFSLHSLIDVVQGLGLPVLPAIHDGRGMRDVCAATEGGFGALASGNLGLAMDDA